MANLQQLEKDLKRLQDSICAFETEIQSIENSKKPDRAKIAHLVGLKNSSENLEQKLQKEIDLEKSIQNNNTPKTKGLDRNARNGSVSIRPQFI